MQYYYVEFPLTEQEDYIGVIHSFCIGHGEEICFDVSIVDDMVPELQEDLQVTLTSTVRNEISLVQIEESDGKELSSIITLTTHCTNNITICTTLRG